MHPGRIPCRIVLFLPGLPIFYFLALLLYLSDIVDPDRFDPDVFYYSAPTSRTTLTCVVCASDHDVKVGGYVRG
ncbi:hypothetical protein DSUL_140020 [Desulfovibrionales bacterium]